MPSTILIVYDDADVRAWLADHLSAAGYEVVAAASGAAALAQLARESFDARILDLRMPGEDGLDVLRRVGQSAPSLEVIVSTGYADVGTVIECLRAGAGDVVPKPCAGAEITAAVSRALERRRLHLASALYQASRTIFASLTDARLPQRIVKAAQQILAADEVSLLVLEGDGRLHLANASGRAAASADGPPLALGERIAGRVLLQRTPVILNGPVEQDPRFRGLCGDQRIRSSIVYPLLAGERSVGVLNLCRVSNPQAFREADLELVAVLASQILLALENGRLARQMVGSERLASIGLVAAGVAHEINNPLAYALANLAFVEQHLGGLAELAGLLGGGAAPEAVRACWQGLGGGKLVEELKDAVRDSGEGMRRIRDITRDLRALARVDADSPETVADLNDAVRSAIRVASAQIRSHATLIERLGADLPVRGSPARLSQVLINLLVNAGQAMADAPAGRGEVVVTTRREGDRVVAQVA
ncbi:MAG: response regulator, partial [Deltaproteobacteria bacterium]|nr:response regulator [Deltaproteobacteria bacterium]